jgi:hypothetical protein
MPQCIITITLEDNGSVSLSAPLDNYILSYGMLQAAVDIVQHYNSSDGRREREQRVTLAPGPLPGTRM